jgi:hypothetical protein
VVAPQEARLGAEIVYRATFRAPADHRIYFPTRPALTPFSVVPGSVVTTRSDEAPDTAASEIVTTTVEFKLRGYRLGTRHIPAIEVPFLGAGSRTGTVTLPRQRVTVAGTLTPEHATSVAPLPSPRSVIATNWTLIIALVVLASVIGVAFLTVLLLWLLKDRLFRAPPPPPPRPAHEVALGKLAAIERERLPEKGAIMEYYVRVSEAVREYLGARYGVDGLFMTTGELVRALAPHDLQGVPLSRVRAFLEECDLVKFASFDPAPKEIEWLLSTAKGLVRETMRVATEEDDAPRPVAAAPPARPMARAFAWSVDFLLLSLLAGGLFLLARLTGTVGLLWTGGALLLLGLLLRDLPRQGSLGKVVTGLGVAGFRPPVQDPKTGLIVPQEGRTPTTGARVWRNVPQLFLFVGQAVEFVFLAYDPDVRRLGDRMGRTAVLDRRARGRTNEVGLLFGALFATLTALAALLVPLFAL